MQKTAYPAVPYDQPMELIDTVYSPVNHCGYMW